MKLTYVPDYAFNEKTQYAVVAKLAKQYKDFKINDTEYPVFEDAMTIIGIAKPTDALQIIKQIHQDHMGEPNNEERYQDNMDIYEDLKNEPYVEIPVDIDLTENTPLPNGYDIDHLYTGEVMNLMEELDEQIKEAHEEYDYDHQYDQFKMNN